MILKIDEISGKVEVKADEGQHHKEHPEVCSALDRVKDELEGVLEYKSLEKKYQEKHPGTQRYATPSMQEFQHMLLALDDFFTELVPMLTPEELSEWQRFKTILP